MSEVLHGPIQFVIERDANPDLVYIGTRDATDWPAPLDPFAGVEWRIMPEAARRIAKELLAIADDIQGLNE